VTRDHCDDSRGFVYHAAVSVQGGSGNDIETIILDQDGFENYSNGHSVRTFYNSGKITVGSINTFLNPGQYYLVFNNRFSLFTNKVVHAQVHMVSQNPLPPTYSTINSSTNMTVAACMTKLLNVRKAPSSNSAIVGRLRLHDRLFVTRDLGAWTEIRWKNSVGYVVSRHVGY
jgi:hypothetical protein